MKEKRTKEKRLRTKEECGKGEREKIEEGEQLEEERDGLCLSPSIFGMCSLRRYKTVVWGYTIFDISVGVRKTFQVSVSGVCTLTICIVHV